MTAPYLLRMWHHRLTSDLEQLERDMVAYGATDRTIAETLRKMRSLLRAARSLAGVEATIHETGGVSLRDVERRRWFDRIHDLLTGRAA